MQNHRQPYIFNTLGLFSLSLSELSKPSLRPGNRGIHSGRLRNKGRRFNLLMRHRVSRVPLRAAHHVPQRRKF
jgi:hypothetical protein